MHTARDLEPLGELRSFPGRGLGFAFGVAAGWAVAPIFALLSWARRARTFHPCGQTFHAVVTRHPETPPELQALAERLAGQALVRFSGALWKHAPNAPDVLGCAVRLRRDDSEAAAPAADDQDLLFATIRRPWTMVVSPFTTDVSDYLGNDYFAVSPFDVGLPRPVYLRLHPAQPSADGQGTRSERLLAEVALGRAELALELSRKPFGPWSPLLVVSLERRAPIDDQELRFRPFNAGRKLHPRGFVHALRLGVYAFSQWARPSRSSQSQV